MFNLRKCAFGTGNGEYYIRDIKPIFDRTRSDANIQWSIISEELPSYLAIILRESIKVKQLNNFMSVFVTIESIEKSALCSSLGDFQKDHILNRLQQYYYYFQLDAIENELILQPYHVFSPSIDLVTRAIDLKYRFVNEIIRRDFKFMAELNSKKLLDFTDRHTVYCGAIGRHCMVNIEKDPFYNQSMHFILDEIRTLKEILELEPRNIPNKLELLSDVKSFIRYYNKDRNKTCENPTISEVNKPLVQKIEDLIASFAD